MHMNKNAAVQNYVLQSNRLCIPFSIVHNATPALKTSSARLSAVTLALEGQTAAAAAIDTGTNFATPTDSTGVFGILVSGLGTVAEIFTFDVVRASAGSVAASPAGLSTSGVTASGNIAFSCDWDGNLATTDLNGLITMDYAIIKA